MTSPKRHVWLLILLFSLVVIGASAPAAADTRTVTFYVH